MIPRRQLMLGAALVATLGAVWWASTLEQESDAAPDQVAATSRPASRGATTAGPRSLAVLVAPRPPLPELQGFLQARSLQPPPPPPPPPPKPRAPTLPFQFVGALDEDGGRAVFLLEGTQVHMVRPGDTLGGRYRVERITATSVEFIYLPLKERQSLATNRP